MPSYELNGQVAVVTGAARGIGRAVAERLAREGADVALFDLEPANGVEAAIRADGRKTMTRIVDVTDRSAVEAGFADVDRELGPVGILVNNAGTLRAAPILEVTDDDWDRHMAVNAKAVLICSQVAARTMVAHGGGRIITIISSAGRLPSSAPIGAYVASKHAAMGIVQQMGRELASRGILVNAVFPGIVDTDMLNEVYRARAAGTEQTPESLRRADVATIPLGRLQLPDDVANMVAFLASADANYSVGQAFDVGGGAFFW